MVHVATGNALDVVFDYDENGIQTLRGLKQHGSDKLIPLPDPQGLLNVLSKVINECELSRMDAPVTTVSQHVTDAQGAANTNGPCG